MAAEGVDKLRREGLGLELVLHRTEAKYLANRIEISTSELGTVIRIAKHHGKAWYSLDSLVVHFSGLDAPRGGVDKVDEVAKSSPTYAAVWMSRPLAK